MCRLVEGTGSDPDEIQYCEEALEPGLASKGAQIGPDTDIARAAHQCCADTRGKLFVAAASARARIRRAG